MKTAFLDANVLFSAAYREKSKLITLWDVKNIECVTSNYAFEEAHRNLTEIEQLHRLEKLIKKTKIVPEASEEMLPKNISLIQKDKPILSAALNAKADYLITGDYKDFGQFFGKSILSIIILPPSAFFDIFSSAEAT